MFDHLKRRGVSWVGGQMVILAGVILGGVLAGDRWHSLVLKVCGVVFLVLAGLIGLAGARALGRNLTPLPRPSAGARLVASGIYSLVRHPLYTAVMCGSLGWALVSASWVALAATAVLVPFFDAKARQEERWLRLQFPEYSDYERRVKRFLPGIY